MMLKYFCLLLLFNITHLFSLEEVGQVINLSGEVYFDVQGTGTYIDLETGDTLYDQSVIKVGRDGEALISVHKKEVVLPPLSTIYIVDLIDTDLVRHGIDQGIYKQFLDFLEKILKNTFANVEKKEKGTIETKQTAKTNTGFLTESSIDRDLFLVARAELLKKTYTKALTSLEAIKNPQALKASPGEYTLIKGLCYFLLGHFRQAAEIFQLAAEQVKPEATAYETEELLGLLPGIACYLLGKNTVAISYLKKLLQLKEPSELRPYGYYFLCSALLRTGQKTEARTYLQAALARFGSHPLHKEWTRLLAGL